MSVLMGTMTAVRTPSVLTHRSSSDVCARMVSWETGEFVMVRVVQGTVGLNIDSPSRFGIALYTSVKIIKNEVRCRDDTVPKTVDTRKHCKVGLRACNNLPQPRKTKM